MSSLNLQSVPWREWPAHRAAWAELLLDNPVDSVFLSEEWVSAWLEVFGPELDPELIFFRNPAGVAGACFLVRRQRNLVRTLYLNCDGEDQADSTYIEYNALLAKPGDSQDVAETLADYLQGQPWDRLIVSGAAPQLALLGMAARLGNVETDARPSYFVDFARLRASGLTHRQAISGNTRKQNNFTRRQLERTFAGECVVEQAITPHQQNEFFSQLALLHTQAWRAKAKPGVFGSEKFLRFHRLLGQKLGPEAALLFRMRVGSTVLAVIYCFEYRGRVYFYQSGILYGADKRLRPGYLALTAVIEQLESRPEITEFDFLAGDAQYKKSLGTDVRELRWMTVWAPSFASGAFRALRSLRDTIGQK